MAPAHESETIVFNFQKLLSTLPNYAELEQILLFSVNWGKQVWANVKKIFSSETAWPNGAKLGIDGPWVCPFQNCVWQPHPPFKMAAVFFKVMIISLWNLLQYHSIVRWVIQAQWAEPLVVKIHMHTKSLPFYLCSHTFIKKVRVMVFNATCNNISVISWQSFLLVEETRVPGENHRPVASHW